MLLTLYKYITILLTPLLLVILRIRLSKGKEDVLRIAEKKGISSLPRPHGKLIWFHGASVGESLSILHLIERIYDQHPNTHILVTTGTRTSAHLMARRLPKHAIHQFLPLDQYHWIERFVKHWQPDLALWVESEIWPNTLNAIKRRHIPSALINARISEKSFQNWQCFPQTIRHLLSTFDVCLAQTDMDAERLEKLGGENIIRAGNIKFASKPLPVDESVLKTFKKHIKDRTILLYASTHDNEEEIAARIHQNLKYAYPDLLSVIVPRHPARANRIEEMLNNSSLKSTRRSLKQDIAKETDMYLADTLGELGLFYKLCPIVFLGNSLITKPGGGHNPIEPAQFGCSVIYGPHMFNFDEIDRDMRTQDAAIQVQDEQDLEKALKKLLSTPHNVKKYGQNAKAFAKDKSKCLDTIMDHITPVINRALEDPIP